jgi:cyclic beta-1,2-glucan synthetase
VETLLGFRIEGGSALVVRPRIPAAWPGFTLRHRLQDGTSYEVAVRQGGGGSGRVREARLDGLPAPIVDGAARVPLARDGAVHRLEIGLE